MADYTKNETARRVGSYCFKTRTDEMKREFSELFDANGNTLDFYILGRLHGEQTAEALNNGKISEADYRKIETLVEQSADDTRMAVAVLAFCMGKGIYAPANDNA
jgi:hypothetical protein